jgi:hypothetical protein
VNAFCVAARGNDEEQYKSVALAVRVAYHAKNEDFKSYIKGKKSSKVVTEADAKKAMKEFAGGIRKGNRKARNNS